MTEIIEAVLTNGLTPVAIIMLVNFGFVFAVLKGWIVLGSTHNAVVKEMELWRHVALQNGSQAQKLLENKDLGVALLESITKETTERTS